MSDPIVYAPAIWPGTALPVQPGDFTQRAPMGMNMGAPLVMRPWDALGDVMGGRAGYYGVAPHAGDPFRDAPLTDPSGGTLYFRDGISAGQLATMLDMMGVNDAVTAFAAFRDDAKNPSEQRYLTQLRLVTEAALGSLYGAAPVPGFVRQPLSIAEAVATFLASERERWGSGMSAALAGSFGGDGDWAREALCFGFTVENTDHGVYRVWSRAWLVTK